MKKLLLTALLATAAELCSAQCKITGFGYLKRANGNVWPIVATEENGKRDTLLLTPFMADNSIVYGLTNNDQPKPQVMILIDNKTCMLDTAGTTSLPYMKEQRPMTGHFEPIRNCTNVNWNNTAPKTIPAGSGYLFIFQ